MDDEVKHVKNLLREMQILLATMSIAQRMQDDGLTRDEACIAARALLIILEEMPMNASREEKIAKAEVVSPSVYEFSQREIEQLHDRKSQG